MGKRKPKLGKIIRLMPSPSHSISLFTENMTYEVVSLHHKSWCFFFHELMKFGCKSNCCSFTLKSYVEFTITYKVLNYNPEV